MAKPFVDTPESTSNRSPIMAENDRLHRRNSIMFGVIVYTYMGGASYALVAGVVIPVITKFFG